ncbi:MAG: HEAT repeat domain-containing protein [Planctomycetales bacterium]|nr:HEAT repeat domain-containing protein [Planctomycetales bacterium]
MRLAPICYALLIVLSSWTRSSCAAEDYSAELPRIPPIEVRDALGTFDVSDGFQLELVAAEPSVNDPVALSFDEHGRLFVVEMRGYSEDDGDRLGVVRMLTDEDQDGTYEHASEFVDDLSWPTAIICYDGGVFVGVAPDILYCKDTDGDGRAEVRQRVFTGFQKHNVQGLLNSFHWGLDNRIHGAASSCGGDVRRVGTSADASVSLRGRDFSFDPRTLDLRAESGGAQHGMSFDAWGRKFVCSNSDHLQAVMMDDRYFARNPYFAAPNPRVSIAADGPQAEVFRISPVEPWRIVRTRLRVAGTVPGPIEGGGRAAGYFTGATGAVIYTGDAWPREYQQSLYAVIGDVGSNIIHRKRIDAIGVGFRGERVDAGREFVASRDIWFRPAQFANGPDGNLYVLDVYREVIEHPASLPPMIKTHLDLTSGRDRGRIYRLAPAGHRFQSRQLPGAASPTEIVAMLAHPNGWHRRTAARLIYERKDPAVVPALHSMANDQASAIGRMHALYALQGLGRLTPELLEDRLHDPAARVREHAIRLGEPWYGGGHETLVDHLVRLVDDDDARVRLQLALSASFLPEPRAVDVLARLVQRDGDEPWMRTAALASSARIADPLLRRLTTAANRGDAAPLVDLLTQVHEAYMQDGGEALERASKFATIRVSPTVTEAQALDPAIARPYEESLPQVNELATDASALRRGGELYQKHCSSCHIVGAGVAGLGPNLATMRNRGAAAILVNVLNPNLEVNPQFVDYLIETQDGEAISGMIDGETATSITLRKSREESRTLLKINVESIRSTGKSLMPEGFAQVLPPDEMNLLIAYLLYGN